MQETKDLILRYLPPTLKSALQNEDFTALEEIRFRAGRDVVLSRKGLHRTVFHRTTQRELELTLQLASKSSPYAYIDEIKNCFLTLEGGHRMGLSGRAVMDGAQIKNLTQISGINIRIAREVLGAADRLFPLLWEADFPNTLILSPPQCGKTTLLRDLARQIGSRKKVALIDERGELAAMVGGTPSHRVGEMTDVMDLCPKALGISLMLRSMSPEVIITDELAARDLGAVSQAFSCGVRVIATAHGDSIEDALERLELGGLLSQFGCIVLLSRREGPCTIETIQGLAQAN